MAAGNPVQFAVVREDPWIESTLVQARVAEQILLIASGGCTAFTLQALFPSLAVTLVDRNPAQLELVRRKRQVLEETRDGLGEVKRKRLFNVGFSGDDGLNACGNFESLFRQFRAFLDEFVAPADEIDRLFLEPGGLHRAPETLFSSRYWPAAFETFFCDGLLRAMFGPEAVQHAPPGSYPEYFRAVIERGLGWKSAARNYFLHHLFLGRYLDEPGCLPDYLTLPVPPKYRFEPHLGDLESLAGMGGLRRFDVVSLSNIFDWMPESEVRRTAQLLTKELKPGAMLVYRQLNHASEFERHFEAAFDRDENLSRELLRNDRSLFYSKLFIGVRK